MNNCGRNLFSRISFAVCIEIFLSFEVNCCNPSRLKSSRGEPFEECILYVLTCVENFSSRWLRQRRGGSFGEGVEEACGWGVERDVRSVSATRAEQPAPAPVGTARVADVRTSTPQPSSCRSFAFSSDYRHFKMTC